MISWRIDKRFFSFCCICLALFMPFILRLTGNVSFLSSHLQMLTLSFLLTVVWIINFQQIMNSRHFAILSACLIMLIVSLLVNGSYGVVVAFYNVCMCLLIFNNLSFSKRQVVFIQCSMAVLLLSLLASFSYDFQYETIWISDKGVSINPNTYGLLWLILFFNLFFIINTFLKSKKIKFLFLILLTAVSGMNIWFSGCRSALIAVILFVCMCLIKKIHFRNAVLLFVVVGLIVPIVYVQLSGSFANVEVLGKPLFSGRESVWKIVLQTIEKSPILGTGTNDSIEWGTHVTDSAHNVYLGFWKALGVVPLIAYIYFLLNGKNVSHVSDANMIYKKAFLASLFVCIVETLFNDSNYNYFFLLLLLTIDDKKRN